MGSRVRKHSQWRQSGLTGLVALALIILDAQTQLMVPLRNALSIALSPIQYVSNIPYRVGRFIGSTLSSEADVKNAYENLRVEYFQLKSEALLLQALQKENQDLRILLGASKRLDERVTLAGLINVTISRDAHTILIGKGLRDGVYRGQAVIDDRGVVGQVTEVMPLTSVVVLITDLEHGLPVQVERTGLRTLVQGTGSVSELRVPFLNKNVDIQVGDKLISSGLGGRFPSGYPVAEISQVEIIEDEKFIQVSAVPTSRLDRSNHVLLLSRFNADASVGSLSNRSKP